MTLQQCRYIVEIAAQHSIRRAAEALYVTQPSISKSIRALEQELGITILDRDNQGVEFTPEGKELLFMAKMLVEQAESITYHFDRSSRSARAMEVSISSQHYCCMDRPLIAFLEKWPQYVVSFREGKSTDVVEDVAESRSILGFLSLNPRTAPYFERVFYERGLEFRELATTVEHVFVRSDHPLAAQPEILTAQLQTYPCLTYRQEDIPLRLSETPLGSEAVARTIYVSDRGTMRDFIRHTDGYNVGTGILNPDEDQIIAVPLADGQKICLGYIKRRQTFLSDALEVYIEMVAQALVKASRRL